MKRKRLLKWLIGLASACGVIAFILVLVVGGLVAYRVVGCTRRMRYPQPPIPDPVLLREECQELMDGRAAGTVPYCLLDVHWKEPAQALPASIAALNPRGVCVNPDRVYIWTHYGFKIYQGYVVYSPDTTNKLPSETEIERWRGLTTCGAVHPYVYRASVSDR